MNWTAAGVWVLVLLVLFIVFRLAELDTTDGRSEASTAANWRVLDASGAQVARGLTERDALLVVRRFSGAGQGLVSPYRAEREPTARELYEQDYAA